MPTPLSLKAKNITSYIQVSCNLPLHSLTPLFTLVQKVLGYASPGEKYMSFHHVNALISPLHTKYEKSYIYI